MKYSINLWSESPNGQDQTLDINVESDESAFEIAKEHWNNDLSAITIERRNGGEAWPTRWRMRWDGRVMRVPNDRCEVGYHLVYPLINGDVSGIDTEDEHHLEEFVAQYPDCVFTPDENEEGIIKESLSRCEVTGMMNQCVTIKVFAQGSAR